MTIETGMLIDHEAAIGPLSQLMETAWPGWYNPRGASARADLSDRMERHRLPLGIVAHLDGKYAGTCALTPSSGGLITERSPWVGGLLVSPELRRRGVGSALLYRARAEARRLGHKKLYALTAEANALFEHENWRVVETLPLGDVAHTVYVVST